MIKIYIINIKSNAFISNGVDFMRKNFGAQSDIYPMPVFIVAAYDEE